MEKRMLVNRKILSWLMCLLFISAAWNTGAHAQEPQKKTPWVLDTPPGENQWITEKSRARVIVFRLARDKEALANKPLNIFLNGSYHASLLPEHQAIALSLCPGTKELGVTLGKIDADSDDLARSTQKTPRLEPETLYFYQVAVDNNGKIFARWVDRDQAKEVLAHVKVQTHTLSRVADSQSCPSSVYSINASALFKLNQYERSGMLPGAMQSIQRLAEQMQKDYSSLDKIIVNGYADPTGNNDKNQLLSQQRAQTVALLLSESGLPIDIITAQGMGASNLIVADCHQRHLNRQQVADCNQPNRRVEVEVYGLKNL